MIVFPLETEASPYVELLRREAKVEILASFRNNDSERRKNRDYRVPFKKVLPSHGGCWFTELSLGLGLLAAQR